MVNISLVDVTLTWLEAVVRGESLDADLVEVDCAGETSLVVTERDVVEQHAPE